MPLKRIFIISILILLLTTSIFVYSIFSTDCTDIPTCQQRVDELRKQADTLSSEIQYIDTQIYLTTLQIQETEQKINKTQKEIEVIDSRIGGLDTSLDYLSKLLLTRIVESYKNRSLSIFTLLFDTGSADDFLNRVKYLKTAQNNNQKLLVQVQETKSNFEQQKKLREDKKIELDSLKLTLDKQKIDLNNQQDAKKNLLAITEAEYEEAKKELAAYSAFARAAGGGLTTFGTGSNGWYYTQRDPAWGNLTLGDSPYYVWEAGCAITSVAMVCNSYGQNVNPATLATNPSKFTYGNLLNDQFNCDGKSQIWLDSPSQDQVKSYVKDKKAPVILKLVAPSVSGLHFIVTWGWDDGKNDFRIHDPYYGPDKYFSDMYNWSQVLRGVVIQ